MKSKSFLIPGIILLLLSLSTTNDFHSASAVSYNGENHQQMERELSKDTLDNQAQDDAEIKHEQIAALTDQFMKMLVQDIDENYKVVKYNTKEEVINQFKKVSTKDVAEPYVDYYYYEEADGLYIVPTETPAWFDEDNDYDVIQLKDNKIRVVQENQDEMYGDYTIAFEFTYDNQWKITKISYL